MTDRCFEEFKKGRQGLVGDKRLPLCQSRLRRLRDYRHEGDVIEVIGRL